MIKDKMDRKSVLKRREKVVELIEIDGKKVSITSTGKRKFHNKSKNGCDNCKRRRVKCDEGKPLCRKCVNMKLDCVYTPAQPKKKRESTAVKYVTRRAASGQEEKVPASEIGDHSSDDSSYDSSRSASRAPHPTPEDLTQADLQEKRIFEGISSKPASIVTPQPFPQAQQLPHVPPHLLPRQQQQRQQQHQQQQQQIYKNEGSRGMLDGLLLPPLGSESSHLSQQQQQQQLQQQLLLLPQLMTLSNSEKYAAFEMPNSPPLQPTGMNITNSIGSIFSPNRFQQQQQQQQQPPAQPPAQAPVQPPNLPSFQAESIAQLNKASVNLKTMGMFPTAGIGGVTYDFQELLGLKYGNSQASKASNAEEALANMQEQQEQASKGDNNDNNNEEAASNNGNDHSVVHMLSTPGLPNNPTISPAAPITPMTKASINAAAATASPSVTTVPSAATTLAGAGRTNQNSAREQVSSNNDSGNGYVANLLQLSQEGNLNLIDLKLFHHYCTKVWPSITAAGISGREVWSTEIPELAFGHPFLMHSLLAFSATHLARTEPGLEPYVSSHRLDALRLLRQAVLQISEDNTDALVASALILIMDSLANASNQHTTTANAMSPSAWIFHVKGAATILTAVWPLTEKSRFYNLISVDLSDLGDIINQESASISELVCFDESIADLYPVEIDSPYLITLAYLDKLQREKNQSDFILRVFAFPALLDKTFLALLMTGDAGAMRIMRSYYKLLRGFTTEMKDKIWFLEGVSQVLPQDVDEYSGGGGMHMMLDFLGGGLPSMTTTNLSEFM